MKKYDFFSLLRLLAAPALTVLMGLVLLLSPDTATALVSRLLGWVFLLLAVADGFSARAGDKKKLLRAVIVGIIGVWVVMNPLSLAKSLGRVLGLTFFIWGVNSLRRNYRDRLTPGIVAAGAVALLGTALFLVPMTATRLVLNIAGIVIIGIGVADGYDRLHGKKMLDDGDDPNIIDVEKL